MKLPRIILADDHALVAEALSKLLSPHFDVVTIVGDGQQLLEQAATLKPDVIVVDLSMPLLNGLDAARELKRRLPSVKLVYLTMNDDPELAIRAMTSGGSAYVLKRSAASELIQAIRAALQGKSFVTPQVARGMEERFIRNPHARTRQNLLTPRQRQVLQLLAEGKSMKEAADILKVTPRTIAFHKYQMMQDLGLKTNADLVQFAIKNRLVA